MNELGLFGTGNWLGILSIGLLVLSVYFTFSFWEQLKDDDKRLRTQSKILAVLCLASALLIPALYNFYVYTEMMR